jgi:phenylpropionate dioxygenase-like ring-hydroxylating dioxygenase large terminal subunit
MNSIEPINTSLLGECESKDQAPLPFPMGWYSVERGHNLLKGQVKPIYAFDRELVLYRTREGQAVVLDAFCPHLGAHLGYGGRVIGEDLRCPFHGWKFGTEGECTEIPYCDDIPERARLRKWHVSETNGDIMVWYHPAGEPPAWDMVEVPELSSDEWSEPQYWEFTIPNHVQNIAENVCDPEHFQYVHKQTETPPSEVTIAENGRTLTLVADAKTATPPSLLTATVENPGLALVRTNYGPGAEMIVYSTAQPTKPNETHMRWTLTVRKEIVDLAGDDVMEGIKNGIFDDYPIWEHKIYREKPIFCKGDKTLVMFRKWVKQFYL